VVRHRVGVDEPGRRDLLAQRQSVQISATAPGSSGAGRSGPGSSSATRAGSVRYSTVSAKPFNDEGGSGFHVHVSVNDEAGRNVFGDPGGPDGLSAVGRHAIGGVLAHARALSALLNPTINSYKRYKRNEIERFERFVTDWEFREYAYHL